MKHYLMRYLFVYVLAINACLCLAQNVAKGWDVTMVSFDQGWFDEYATIALRNDAMEDIDSVWFRITYIDMSGTPLDFKDFTRIINIPMGLTKKINIPAYERRRHYHYFKSDGYANDPSFNITFKLLGYNEKVVEASTEMAADEGVQMEKEQGFIQRLFHVSSQEFVTERLPFIVFAGFWIGFVALVGVLARKYHRSMVGWLLVGLLVTPLMALFILVVLGESRNGKRRDDFITDKDNDRFPHSRFKEDDRFDHAPF